MKTKILFSLSTLFAVCLTLVCLTQIGVRTVCAADTVGTTPEFGRTMTLKSVDGEHIIIATGIKNLQDVYGVGYTITKNSAPYTVNGDELKPEVAETGKYFTGIRVKTGESTTKLFGIDDIYSDNPGYYDGLIVWEINYAYADSFTYKAYALVGNRDGENNLVIPDPVNKQESLVRETPVTYSVAFKNGAETVNTKHVENGSKASAPAAAPDRMGYTFNTWQKDGVDFDFNTAITSDTELDAGWTVNDDTAYTAEAYLMNVDGTYPVAATSTVNKQGTTEDTAEIDAAWFGGVPTGFEVDNLNANNVFSGEIAGDGSLVLKVYVKRTDYTVSFNSNGGSAVDSQTVRFGATATKPSDSAKNGYVFCYWKNSDAEYDFSTAVSGDITLTAQWKLITYISNASKFLSIKNDRTGYYVLTSDIDLGGINIGGDWSENDVFPGYYTGGGTNYSTGGFIGTLDGAGHSIYNFSIGANGLFGAIGIGGKVTNLGIEQINGWSDGWFYGGLFIGENWGTVENVSIKLTAEMSAGLITQAQGIVGCMETGSVMRNVVIYSTCNVKLSALTRTPTIENVLFVSNQMMAPSGFTVLNADTYLTDGTLEVVDFSGFDTSSLGYWTIDETLKIPLIK